MSKISVPVISCSLKLSGKGSTNVTASNTFCTDLSMLATPECLVIWPFTVPSREIVIDIVTFGVLSLKVEEGFHALSNLLLTRSK